MSLNLDLHHDQYACLYADCIPVKGAERSALYDLTRNEIVLFPSTYYDMLDYLAGDTIGNLLHDLDEEERQYFTEFLHFLNDQEMLLFTAQPALFPAIAAGWDLPARIGNAVIDIDERIHDFNKIIPQLDALTCHFIQIRCFSALLGIEALQQILDAMAHTSIQSVVLILKYNVAYPDKTYIRLMEDYPLIGELSLHSAPEDRELVVDYGCDEEAAHYIKKIIRVSSQQLSSARQCGIINQNNLCAPTVNNFFENKQFNGCLNRKVSVDASGAIKNCPSMQAVYGHIDDTELDAVVARPDFQRYWNINKDQVAICRDCEFRYACTDCRAYLEQPDDLYSKPLKCGYDPYTAVWETWSKHPMKQAGIAYYGLQP